MSLCRKKRRDYVHLSAVSPSRGEWERNSISEVWTLGTWSQTAMMRMRRVKNPSAWPQSRANIRVEVWGVCDVQNIYTHGASWIKSSNIFRLYHKSLQRSLYKSHLAYMHDWDCPVCFLFEISFHEISELATPLFIRFNCFLVTHFFFFFFTKVKVHLAIIYNLFIYLLFFKLF